MFANWLGRCRALRLLPAVLVTWLLVGAGSAYAQQGAVAGTVTDSETQAPVAGAQVYIPGTVIGTLTSANGTYRLEGVPTGSVTLEVRLIGYKDATQTVTVEAGQVATADFVIEQTALRLQDIVVTGVVAETPRVKLPFTVERLDPDDIPVPTSDVSTLLAGKGAGVSVVQGSGQPGAEASITLRGPTSIDADGRSQGPLIVIDGVIQGESGSLADINTLDIDHIEIVKGAAAASLYGARAQAGVIQITTKRGTNLATNTFDVTLRGEYGLSDLENGIGLHSQHHFLMNDSQTKFLGASTGQELDWEQLGRVESPALADGGTPATAFQDNPFPGQLYDHIDRFFDPGETYSLYGAATGRFGESSFRASFETYKEQGVIQCSQCAEVDGEQLVKDEGYERYNARLNIDSRLGSQIDIAASGFYSNSEQDDTAVNSGAFFALTFMAPAADLTDTGADDPDYAEFFDGLPRIDIDPTSQEENPLYQIGTRDDFDRSERIMGSLDASWTPIDWFSVEGTFSYDRTNFDQTNLQPKSDKEFSGTTPRFTEGSLFESAFTEEALGGQVTAGFNYGFMDGDLVTRLKARYVIENQEVRTFNASGNTFSVDDVPNFGSISGTKQATNQFREIKGEGYFGIASIDYKGRYIADGLVRRDGSSLFGPDERWHTYYRVSGAWRVSQEDFWNLDFWDEFKLRASYGTAGGRPNFFAQYETFGVAEGLIFPINLGNKALKPEFTTETELGANFVFLQTLGLDVTYAFATTDDQLLEVPQPGFVGFQSQWRNAGEIESKTWEASLRWGAIDTPDMGLTFRATFDRTTNEITRLDVPAYTAQGSQTQFWVAEGEELGAMWGSKWATSCSDIAGQAGAIDAASWCADYGDQFEVNDDGLIVYTGDASFQDGIAQSLWGTSANVGGGSFNWGMPIKTRLQRRDCLQKNPEDAGVGEVCPLSDFQPIGSGTPDWNGTFFTNFRWKELSLAFLLDGSFGHEVYNGTNQWSYREKRNEDIDQGGKSEGLKKPVEYYSILYDTNSSSGWFVEDGTWVKVREISLGYSFPQSFLQDVFKGTVDRLTLNLIGRNLFTFTDYTGYDPEVGASGGDIGSASLAREASFGYPNFRTFTASLEVVF